MATYSKLLVEIPDDEGVHTKTAGAKGEKYVYKYVKYFRNADGNPRNKAKAIGKYDTTSGMMFPNSNYFEFYNLDSELPDIDVWDYGYSYLALKACQDMGLMRCLVVAFGERAMDVVVMAAYIIREGGVMDGIDDWQQRNYFPGYARLLTSQSTSKIFRGLTVKQMNAFFAEWVKAASGGGTVCYDVTSISSYAQQMSSVERGYNRDGEDLAQFNLGLFCDEKNRVPLYYNRYNGSLTDKTNLSYVLENARAIGINRVKMVLDGGFWDEDCFSGLCGLCDAFMAGMPASLAESKRILESHAHGIENYANRLSIPHTYCVSIETEVWGVSGKALLYFDSLSHVQLCDALAENVNRLSAELAGLKRYPKSKLNRYKPYFAITKKDCGFDYAIDAEKVDKSMKHKGFFLIFTTDMDSTPEDTLRHYRAKDAAEKMFDQIKCDMDGGRIRTHNERTTDGKVFVIFVACIIRSYLQQKLEQYLTDNSTSLKKTLNQLSNISIVSGSNGLRFTKALTKKQKQILKSFNANTAILKSL
jgi:transposase